MKFEDIVKIKLEVLKLRIFASWLGTGGYIKESLKEFRKADKLEKLLTITEDK